MMGGDRDGKEGERAGEKEYGVDKPLSFPVTVNILSKLKFKSCCGELGKYQGIAFPSTAYERAEENRIDIHRDW